MGDLFQSDDSAPPQAAGRPLADRLRPKTLAEVVGQERLTGPEGAPTAGPPPYGVYTVVPSNVYACPNDEDGPAPTRWRFDVWP
jgi:hypothetical protein